jgi:hypothetical protein
MRTRRYFIFYAFLSVRLCTAGQVFPELFLRPMTDKENEAFLNYDNVMYAELSDFFYVRLKSERYRQLTGEDPEACCECKIINQNLALDLSRCEVVIAKTARSL